MTADFAPHNMGSNTSPSPYVVTASSQFSGDFQAFNAFNYLVRGNSYWVPSGSTGWLKIYIGTTNYLLSGYQVRVNTIPEPNRAPKNWTMQVSTNGINWTVADTQTNQTSWGSGETRSFNCANPSAGCYFMINITANNGDGLAQIEELFLLGEVYVPPASYLKNRGRSRIDFTGVSLL